MAQVELRDEYGNPVELTDAYGNPVWLTDEKGNPVHLTGVATIADHTLQTPQHIPLHSNPTSTLISFEDKGFEEKSPAQKGKTEIGKTEMKEHYSSPKDPKDPRKEEEKEEEEEDEEEEKEELSHTKTCTISSANNDNHTSTIKGIIEKIKESLPGQSNH